MNYCIGSGKPSRAISVSEVRPPDRPRRATLWDFQSPSATFGDGERAHLLRLFSLDST